MTGADNDSENRAHPAKLPACAAVIVAAGSGTRMGGSRPKQFLTVRGKTILRHCLDLFLGLDELKQIVVVLPADRGDQFRQDLLPSEAERVIVVAGGPTRQESVLEGLMVLDESVIEMVAIHDAARPLVRPELIRETLRVAAAENCGAIACQPVQDTVKRSGDNLDVRDTVQRENLWLAQTPQSFPLEMILEAHHSARRQNFWGTDDSALFEWLEMPVRIVASDAGNLKVTTLNDLPYLEYRLEQRRRKGKNR